MSIEHTRNEGSAAHNGVGDMVGKSGLTQAISSVLLGSYSFDRGVFVGKIAGINIWN